MCGEKTSVNSVIAILSFALALLRSEASLQLTCQEGNSGTDIVQLCTGSGTLESGEQDVYDFQVASDPGQTTFEGFDVDLDVRLSSVTGNADLQVDQPQGASLRSQRKAGTDIVYVNMHEVSSGTYTFTVSGVATASNYILMVYVTAERLLNPNDQLLMGQVQSVLLNEFLIDCCNGDPTSCLDLKRNYSRLADNDNSTNPNFCYIHGNVCSRDGRMEEVSMPGNNMSCSFPAKSLMSLPRLERIDLSNNAIYGRVQDIAIATSLAPSLQFLDLSNNTIQGNLSAACGLAATGFMEQIALANNNISGSIPGCLTSLKNLVELRLDNNRLSGSVPLSSSAKISKLVYFTAANQTTKGGGLNGSLPASIGELSRLAYLDFSGNQLTGNLPSLPSTMISASFAANNLSNSGAPEAVPARYGNLPILTSLDLSRNALSGYLPSEIASAPSLLYLDISQNSLSSTLPADWTGNLGLGFLKLDNNQLTGTIPGSLANLQDLVLMDVSCNQFSGTLDDYAYQADVGDNDDSSILRYLNISNNALLGPLTDVYGLEELGVFTIQAYALTGTNLPGTQTNLTLDMSGNGFSGTWPHWLFRSLLKAPAKVNLNLAGSTLTCPSAGFQVQTPIPKGYLDGLTCQGTDAGGAIVQIPLSQVVQVAKKDSLPGGAIFGIVLAVLVGLGAMAYGGWFWHKRSQRQKANAAAHFGSDFGGFGNYPPQGRAGAGANKYSAFSDDHQAWTESSHSGLGAPGSQASPAKAKQLGLASIPLSQKGDF